MDRIGSSRSGRRAPTHRGRARGADPALGLDRSTPRGCGLRGQPGSATRSLGSAHARHPRRCVRRTELATVQLRSRTDDEVLRRAPTPTRRPAQYQCGRTARESTRVGVPQVCGPEMLRARSVSAADRFEKAPGELLLARQVEGLGNRASMELVSRDSHDTIAGDGIGREPSERIEYPVQVRTHLSILELPAWKPRRVPDCSTEQPTTRTKAVDGLARSKAGDLVEHLIRSPRPRSELREDARHALLVDPGSDRTKHRRVFEDVARQDLQHRADGVRVSLGGGGYPLEQRFAHAVDRTACRCPDQASVNNVNTAASPQSPKRSASR